MYPVTHVTKIWSVAKSPCFIKNVATNAYHKNGTKLLALCQSF